MSAPRKTSTARKAPARPAAAPEPQDYQPPADTLEAEASGVETMDVEFRGETFQVPLDVLDWHRLAKKAFREGQPDEAVPYLLAPVQYAKFVARFGETVRPAAEFGVEVTKALGFGASGN